MNYRNIVIRDVICAGENAIGAVGTGNNYENVTLRGITWSASPLPI